MPKASTVAKKADSVVVAEASDIIRVTFGDDV
jgi:hypothetical protein